MSPLKQSEKQELSESLKKLSDFFDNKKLCFEGQSKEKGFDVSEFAAKKIISHFISTAGIKLLSAEKQAIFEAFLEKRDLASLKSLKLTSAFRRVCFEIARHENFITEEGLHRGVELNNVLKNSLAKLLRRSLDIYNPKVGRALCDKRKSLERVRLENDPFIWDKIRALEEAVRAWKDRQGMKSAVKAIRGQINKMKEIAAKSKLTPLLSKTRYLRHRLTPRIRRGRR